MRNTMWMLFAFFLAYQQGAAQSEWDIRFSQSSIDCNGEQVCYRLEVASANASTWTLGDQNYRFFFDGDLMTVSSVSSLLPAGQYGNANIDQNIKISGAGQEAASPLDDIDDNLGFLDFSIVQTDKSNPSAAQQLSGGVFIPVAEICVDAASSAVNGADCLAMYHSRPSTAGAITTQYTTLTENDSPNSTIIANGLNYDDLTSADGPISCLGQQCGAPPVIEREWDIRLSLDDVDCSTSQVCYNLEVQNNGGADWTLGDQNYRLFFDGDLMTVASVTSQLPASHYGSAVIDQNMKISGQGQEAQSPLDDIDDNLGFLDFSIVQTDKTNPAAATQLTAGTFLTTARICVDVDASVLDNPANDTCLSFYHSRPSTAGSITSQYTTITENDAANSTVMSQGAVYDDLTAADGSASCLGLTCPSPEEWDIRLSLDNVDCSTSQVCYNLEVQNNGGADWTLGDQNYRLFFDGDLMTVASVTSQLPASHYGSAVIDQNMKISGQGQEAQSPLDDIDDNLGFLDFNIIQTDKTNPAAATQLTAGTFLTTARICVDVDASVLDNPANDTCLSFYHSRPSTAGSITSQYTTITENDAANSTAMSEGAVYDDLTAADGSASCLGLTCPAPAVEREWDIRLSLDNVDCSTSQVCYNLEVQNNGGADWTLGDQNYRLFFDGDLMTVASVTSQLPASHYESAVIEQNTKISGQGQEAQSPLDDIDDNLGFLDFNIVQMDKTNPAAAAQLTAGAFLTTARICVDVDASVLDNPANDTCLSFYHSRPSTAGGITTQYTTITENDAANSTVMSQGAVYDDLTAADGSASCLGLTCPTTEEWDIRLSLDDVDCSTSQVCYNLEVQNNGGADWTLGDQNYRLFFDGDLMTVASVTSQLPASHYGSAVIDENIKISGQGQEAQSPLDDIDNNLGFLDFNIIQTDKTNPAAATQLTAGTFLTTARICVDVDASVLDNPANDTCLSFYHSRPSTAGSITSQYTTISENDAANSTAMSQGAVYDDLTAADGSASCLGLTCPAPVVEREWDIRLSLDDVDCSTSQVCYNLEVQNNGGSDWTLGDQNYRLFFDGDLMTVASVISQLPASHYGNAVIEQNMKTSGQGQEAQSPLDDIDDNLGFLDFNIVQTDKTNPAAATQLTAGAYVATAQICVDVDASILDNPANDACLSFYHSRPSTAGSITTQYTTITENDATNSTVMSEGAVYDDLTAADGSASCLGLACPTPVVEREWDIRLSLDDVDCGTSQVCYNLEVQNNGGSDWTLGDQNYRLFFDGDLMTVASVTSQLPASHYGSAVIDQNIKVSGQGQEAESPLDNIDDNLGFLDFNIIQTDKTNPAAATRLTAGAYVATARICVDVNASILDNPANDACLAFYHSRPSTAGSFTAQYTTITENDAPNSTLTSVGVNYDDLTFADGNDACLGLSCAAPPVVNTWDIDLVRTSVSCLTNQACFALQVRNGESGTWVLGDQDYRLFFDGDLMTVTGVTSQLPASHYGSAVIAQNVKLSGQEAQSPLDDIDDNLGFLDFSIPQTDKTNPSAALNLTTNYVTVAEICVDLAPSVFGDLNVDNCLVFYHSRPVTAGSVTSQYTVLTENDAANSTTMTTGSEYNDLTSDDVPNSCISRGVIPDVSLVVSDTIVCSGTGASSLLFDSEPGISYELRNAANDSLIGTATGTGDTLSFMITDLETVGTFTYFISAFNPNTECEVPLTDMAVIEVQGCDFQDFENPCDEVPCHLVSTDIFLGGGVSSEASTGGSPTADSDDDDGVIFPNNIRRGITMTLPITIFNNTGNDAFLTVWIDWNGNGDFEDAGEQVIDAVYAYAGNNGSFNVFEEVDVPATAVTGQNIPARFRVSTDDVSISSPCGNGSCATDGEIEDYLLQVECPPELCLPVELSIKRGN